MSVRTTNGVLQSALGRIHFPISLDALKGRATSVFVANFTPGAAYIIEVSSIAQLHQRYMLEFQRPDCLAGPDKPYLRLWRAGWSHLFSKGLLRACKHGPSGALL